MEVLKKKLASTQEESTQLRKSLTHVQGELDQQQRLNHALAQRNVGTTAGVARDVTRGTTRAVTRGTTRG